MGPKSHDKYPYKKFMKEIHMEWREDTEKPWKGRDRNLSYVVTAEESLKPLEAGRGKEKFSP